MKKQRHASHEQHHAAPHAQHHKHHAAQKSTWQKIWYFLWYEDSVLSWVVSILLAFLLIKFIIYPGLGLVFGTQFPVVAVVSNSMEHDGSFDTWWSRQEDQYLQFNITKNEFSQYQMRNGFDKGDIIILVGAKPERLKTGQVVVYWGGKQYPIIHRIVAKNPDGSFQTKGDHNTGQIVPPLECGRYADRHGMDCLQNTPGPISYCCLNEKYVAPDQVVGRAVLRVPYLGWVKIGFVSLLNKAGIPAA